MIPDLTRAFNKRFATDRTECAIRSALGDRKIKCGRKSGGIRSFYTKKYLKFLRNPRCLKMSIPALTVAFNAKFHLKKSVASIKSALSHHKIKGNRHQGHPKGTLLKYTSAQARFIKKRYRKLDIRTLTVAFNNYFGTDKTEIKIRAFTRNHQIKSGRTGYFEKGQNPWNTGTKGLCHGSCTSFKKGNIPANVKPLGTERKDNRTDPTKSNYRHIKVAEPNPYTKAPTRYRLKHILVWEKKHGPVPPGMIVVFKDGDEDNCKIGNLLLITRAEHLRLNKYRYKKMPADLKPSILALAKLEVKTFGLLKKQEGNLQPSI